MPLKPPYAENARKSVHIRADGRVFIGDDEFPYPITADGIQVKYTKAPYNELTLTLLVSEVTMDVHRHRNFVEDEAPDGRG